MTQRRVRAPGRGRTAALAALAALADPAGAQTESGGTPSAPKPVIASVSCPRGCDDLEPGRAGEAVRITGRRLDSVATVVFLGAPGPADDAAAVPRRRGARFVLVSLPSRARSGPVAVLGADGSASKPSAGAIAVGSRGSLDVPKAITNGPIVARLAERTAFFGGRRPAALAYTVRGSAPAAVRVDLVRVADGSVAARWGPSTVAPGAEQTVTWDGLSGKRVPPDGRYRFDVFTGAAAEVGANAAQAAGPTVSDSFLYLTHVFPIRGRHDFGVNVNRFGPISGRGHRGQDVLADCGTPLVAARGGSVKVNSFQGAAGNYIVIDEEGSRFDHAYLHLRERALVGKGERVRTGQLIGHVGTTGSSTACHLHFELWDGPWWGGGRAIDPLPALRAWDRASSLAMRARRG